MFTEQASQLRAELLGAAQAGNMERFVDKLVTALGKCSQPLEHRGPVTFGGEDPPNTDWPDTFITQQITMDYALNLAEGSHANFQGDVGFAGDVWNVDNTTSNYNVTENYEGDSTVNYGGNTVITFGPNVTLIFNNPGNCKELMTDVTVDTGVIEFVSDVSFDEETCELTVDKSSAMVVQDVTPVTEHLAVLGECEPEEE